MTLRNLAIFAAIAAVLYWFYKKRNQTVVPIAEAAQDFGFGSNTNLYIDSTEKEILSSVGTSFSPAPGTGVSISSNPVLDQSGKTSMF